MKTKIFVLALVCMLALFLVSGCGETEDETGEEAVQESGDEEVFESVAATGSSWESVEEESDTGDDEENDSGEPSCGDGYCDEFEAGECEEDCPSCSDGDIYTKDFFDFEKQECQHSLISPYCGDGVCEAMESSCIDDCGGAGYTLSDYPIPYIDDYKLNTYIIVGEDATSSDVIAATMIVSGVKFSEEIGDYRADMLDSDLDSIDNKNAILIGNGCTNKFVAELMPSGEECNSNIPEGQAYLKMFKTGDDTYALVVAGHTEAETKRAAYYLQTYTKHKFNGQTSVLFEFKE